ncbi:MAG: hypothetical protein AAGA75_28160 [Cyanobacteria bacterium P01_E01_bin.6]
MSTQEKFSSNFVKVSPETHQKLKIFAVTSGSFLRIETSNAVRAFMQMPQPVQLSLVHSRVSSVNGDKIIVLGDADHKALKDAAKALGTCIKAVAEVAIAAYMSKDEAIAS